MDAVDRERGSSHGGGECEPIGSVSACDPAWLARATLAFATFALVLRVTRYLLIYPLWCDETMLGANLLERGYLDLLRPLDHRQVSPILFLFAELTVVKWLGFSELTLRLFPFACGVAGVFLFRHLAGRILRGEALLIAVAIFAVSHSPIRFAGELKPYASDLFVSLALLAMAVEWRRRPERTVWLWGLALFAPLAIGLSFPAILMAGGVSLGLAGTIWRSGRRDVRSAYFLYNLAVAATFVSLLRFYETDPRDAAYFNRDWAPAFPPLTGAVKFAAWFVDMNTGPMFAYPEGGDHGASALTFLCFVTATVVLWRRRRREVLALCLAPFGLALVAAAMHRYPYGLSARTMQYVAPTICLLAGLGAAAMLGTIGGVLRRRRALYSVVAVLAAFGFGRMAFDLSHPYRGVSDELHRGFARWFWPEKARNAELVCLGTDFGVKFSPAHWTKDGIDTYLCYQKIYSPRHRRGVAPRLDAVSATHPLRFVFFNEFPESNPKFRTWLDEMRRDFDLRGVDFFPISAPAGRKPREWNSSYVVYEFIPKPGRPAGTLVGISGDGPVRR